jgi:hypothetical protein
VTSLRERVESDELFFDSGIISHGYAAHLRDYDVVLDVPAALPAGVPIGDTTGSYIQGRYSYRFTHCPEIRLVSTVSDETWRQSWDDLFIDYKAWERAGKPEGFAWYVGWVDAYPGLSYVVDPPVAASWAQRLNTDMHEVEIETNVFILRLVFHDLRIEQLAVGDPQTRTLKAMDED